MIVQPIILTGQVYYDETKNDYLVVYNRKGEMIYYKGLGFSGVMEDIDFIERFQPVDPADLTTEEASNLLSFCSSTTTLRTGYLKED